MPRTKRVGASVPPMSYAHAIECRDNLPQHWTRRQDNIINCANCPAQCIDAYHRTGD